MVQYSVTIPPRVLAGLRREAVAAAPTECCGALIGSACGRSLEVRTLIPVPNAAAGDDRYLIDADVVIRLERRAACAGLHVVGFYHSHPRGSAAPSPLDLSLASPGFLYLIVQPQDGSIRGWRVQDDRRGFIELPVVVPAAGAA